MLSHVEVLGVFGQDFFEHPPRANGPLGGRREDQLGAEGLQHLSALQALDLRHNQDGMIAFDGGDIGHRHAGVATGGLN